MRKYSHIFILISIILACIIPYINSVNNPFIWDEEVMIVGNPIIKDWRHLPEAFKTNIFGGPINASGYYRPIYTLSFMLNYSVGKLNTMGYHIFNIILHILNGILLYAVILRLRLPEKTAWMASLLFVLFPINCHAVTLIGGRIEPILAALWLLCFISFLNGIERSGTYFLGSVFLFISGLLTKESTLIWSFILFVYVLIFLEKDKRRKTIMPLAILISLSVVYFGLRFAFIRSSSHGTLSLINEASFLERLYTFPRILFTYIQVTIVPLVLKSEYNFVVHSFRDPYVWLGTASIALIFFLALRFLKPARHALFFLCWFLMGLAPYSNLIVPLHATLMEHWGYFSSMGIAALISMAIFKIADRISRWQRYVFAAIVAFLLIFYAGKIMERNKEWGDPFVLYGRDSKREPDSFLLHCNLGVEYFRRGMFEDARREFTLSNQVCPGKGYDMAYNNLGVICAREGKFKEAIPFYKNSVQLNDCQLAYQNLGALYNSLRMNKESLLLLEKGARLHPFNIEILYQLGIAYYENGQLESARQAFLQVEKLQENYSETRRFLDLIR